MLDISNLYCSQCGEKLILEIRGSNAVRSLSPRYDNHGNVLPICRKCAIAQFEIYIKRYQRLQGLANKKLALFRFCESYDFPFFSRFVPKAESQEFLFDYLRKLWSFVNVSKKSYTFDDSDVKNEKELLTASQIKSYFSYKQPEQEIEEKDKREEKKNLVKYEKLREKWGNNTEWDDSDYDFLETSYKELIPKDIEPDGQLTQTIKSCCMYLLVERIKIMEGDTSAAKSARDAMDKALASINMRKSDIKEHREALLQDITLIMEKEDVIEPWDYVVHYDHTLDLVEKVALICLNDVRKILGAEPLKSLEQGGYKLTDDLGQCLKEPSEWEKRVKEELSTYSKQDDYIDEKGDNEDYLVEGNLNGEQQREV